MDTMTKKEFLRNVAAWGVGLFCGGEEREPGPEPEADPVLAGVAADFPDEVLREEARRLGLDPEKASREEMLRAVVAAMRAPEAPQA